MNEAVFARARDVVWRLGPDRILARSVRPGAPGHELFGAAILVWLALDETGCAHDVFMRVCDDGPDDVSSTAVDSALMTLVEHDLVEVLEPGTVR